MIGIKLLLGMILAAAASCDPGGGSGPGAPGYMATMTVFNRTTAEVRVWTGQGGQRSFTVPACGEATAANFPVNFWWLGSEGRNAFHSGGGIDAPQSFVVVTDTPSQTEALPSTLPPCAGLLQGP